MKLKKKKYQTPFITSKKVKINFFLTRILWIDQFNFVGDVYAQYPGAGGGNDGSYGECKDASDGYFGGGSDSSYNPG